eukprot:TRINITY_DN7102_c0_g1_i1.p1 TRINITY_DN7102_c0_g1~~TRINITY_DN7102_c0_g1_i1.p1  ORF type:complete len:421 (+),score=133.44 TRINITY_DN7102_c0_g1_i1:65-1327(+)
MAMMRSWHLILLLSVLSLLVSAKPSPKESKEHKHKAEEGKKTKDVEKGEKDLKDKMKACFSKSGKAAVEACLKEAKKEAEKMAEKLYSKLSPKMREKREKHAEKEAAMESLGDSLKACFKNATTTKAKMDCKKSLTKKKGEKGLKDSVDDILSNLQMDAAIKAGKSCNTTDRKACLKKGKDGMKDLGMKARKYAKTKRLAEVKAAAQAWASCKDAGNVSDASCDSIAKERFEEVSGASNAWTDKLKAHVQKLGKALYNGEEIKMKKLKKVQVDTFTTSTSCKDAEMNKTITEILKIVNASGKAFQKVVKVGCRLVQALAEHQFLVETPKLNETDIDLLSEQISTKLNGTSLSRRLAVGRRLAAITESNADIAVELDSSADTSSSSSGGSSGSSTGSSVSGAMRSAVPLMMAVLLLLTMLQ